MDKFSKALRVINRFAELSGPPYRPDPVQETQSGVPYATNLTEYNKMYQKYEEEQRQKELNKQEEERIKRNEAYIKSMTEADLFADQAMTIHNKLYAVSYDITSVQKLLEYMGRVKDDFVPRDYPHNYPSNIVKKLKEDHKYAEKMVELLKTTIPVLKGHPGVLAWYKSH